MAIDVSEATPHQLIHHLKRQSSSFLVIRTSEDNPLQPQFIIEGNDLVLYGVVSAIHELLKAKVIRGFTSGPQIVRGIQGPPPSGA